MNVPDIKTALALLRQKTVPIHIIRHSVMVTKVARVLYQHLDPSLNLDKDLIVAGALLHDISKYDSIRFGGDHAYMGAKILTQLGYPQVAEIVRQHVRLDHPIAYYSRPNEAIIVNYADKRVKHSEIVGLDQRFKDLIKRYGKSREIIERIKLLFKESQEMEKMIFSYADIGPEFLNGKNRGG